MKIKKSHSKIFSAVASGVLLSFFTVISVNASGIFPKSYYTLSQGKDILLSGSSRVSYDKEWHSSNTKVATVDNRGIVHSVSRGKTKIKAVDKKNHTESFCTVEVTAPELLKNCYSSKGMAGKNESFEICAITHQKVSKVKFKISGDNYYREVECWSGAEERNSKIWKTQISIPKDGKFSVHIDCYSDGKWKNCDNKSVNDILISESSGEFSANLREKRVSAKCAQFIYSCEGDRSKVYADNAGYLTIGCGKRIYPYEPFYNNLSKDEILGYFMETLNQGSYSRAVNNFLMNNKIKNNQHQFDALVSFSFNLGAGWIYNGSYLKTLMLSAGSGANGKLKAIANVDDALRVRERPDANSRRLTVLRGGDQVSVLSDKKYNNSWYKIRTENGVEGYCHADFLSLYRESGSGKSLSNIKKNEFVNEFLQYHHAGGRCLSGLLSRRAQELDMFFKGKYSRYDYQYYKKMNYKRPKCTEGKF
ncbi:MAG: SH3 domain-containing protein [Clostridia bacterium]|nr:SH3 domain-containing protein [Clostridia bacterium]